MYYVEILWIIGEKIGGNISIVGYLLIVKRLKLRKLCENLKAIVWYREWQFIRGSGMALKKYIDIAILQYYC